MTSEQLVSGKEFCSHHHIEMHFLQSLQQFGLLEITTVEEDCLLHPDQVTDIEQMIRLHYDLQVNFEGIDVIKNLLQQMEDIKMQLAVMQNRLKLYNDVS